MKSKSYGSADVVWNPASNDARGPRDRQISRVQSRSRVLSYVDTGVIVLPTHDKIDGI